MCCITRQKCNVDLVLISTFKKTPLSTYRFPVNVGSFLYLHNDFMIRFYTQAHMHGCTHSCQQLVGKSGVWNSTLFKSSALTVSGCHFRRCLSELNNLFYLNAFPMEGERERVDICIWWPLTGRFVSESLYLHPNQFEQDLKGWHQQGTLPLFKWISSIWYILRLIEDVSLCGIHQHYRRHSMTFCLHVYLLEQNRTPPKGEPTLLLLFCVSLRGQNRHEDQTLLCDWHLEHVPC